MISNQGSDQKAILKILTYLFQGRLLFILWGRFRSGMNPSFLAEVLLWVQQSYKSTH
jgi:hypothetical protein